MENLEIPLAAFGAVLTLLIFSYLLGDNPLYRLALHIFVGTSVAYVFVVAFRGVILPALSPPDTDDSTVRLFWMIRSLVGVILGALLLTRGVRGLAWLSAIPVAILLGVGVAVALGGAVLGTLTSQLAAAADPTVPETLQPLGRVLAVLGTVTGLMVFSFTGRQSGHRFLSRLLNEGARVGRWFVLVGLGAVYGGVLIASLSFFADRVQYFFDVLEKLGLA